MAWDDDDEVREDLGNGYLTWSSNGAVSLWELLGYLIVGIAWVVISPILLTAWIIKRVWRG